MLKAVDFFNLTSSPFQALFKESNYVWEALKELNPFLKEFIKPNMKSLDKYSPLVEKTIVLHEGDILDNGFQIDRSGKKPKVIYSGSVLEGATIIYAGSYLMDDNLYFGKDVVVEPGALISGPTYIGDRSEVRQGAYIRGNVLIGCECVVGHATEIKSSVMLGESKAGHFAYIGDSILGKVNLGAGTKLANLKLIDSPVILHIGKDSYETGLRKVGAIIGDGVETGCNSVTTPGTMLGKNTLLYPNTTARGYSSPGSIIKPAHNPKKIDLGSRRKEH